MNDNDMPPSILRWVAFLSGAILWAVIVGGIYCAAAFVFYNYNPSEWGIFGRLVCTVLAVVTLFMTIDAFTDKPSAGQE